MTTIPVLRARADVEFERIAPAGFRILAALDGATKVLGRDIEITSGTDSHTTGRHPTGEAFDVSVQGWTILQIDKIARYLRQVLGDRFTVLYETPSLPSDPMEAAIAYVNPEATGKHLHLQAKRGSVYPPAHPVGLQG